MIVLLIKSISLVKGIYLKDSASEMFLGSQGSEVIMSQSPMSLVNIDIKNIEGSVDSIFHVGSDAITANIPDVVNKNMGKMYLTAADTKNNKQFFKLVLGKREKSDNHNDESHSGGKPNSSDDENTNTYVILHKGWCLGYDSKFDKNNSFRNLDLVPCKNFTKVIKFIKITKPKVDELPPMETTQKFIEFESESFAESFNEVIDEIESFGESMSGGGKSSGSMNGGSKSSGSINGGSKSSGGSKGMGASRGMMNSDNVGPSVEHDYSHLIPPKPSLPHKAKMHRPKITKTSLDSEKLPKPQPVAPKRLIRNKQRHHSRIMSHLMYSELNKAISMPTQIALSCIHPHSIENSTIPTRTTYEVMKEVRSRYVKCVFHSNRVKDFAMVLFKKHGNHVWHDRINRKANEAILRCKNETDYCREEIDRPRALSGQESVVHGLQ